MALSFVSSAFAAAAVVNLPSFQPGDIAVVFAYRNGNTAAPGNPGGGLWDDIVATAGANTNSRRIAYRVLQSGDTSTGTFTNATAIQVIVLRGQHSTSPIGNNSSGGTNNSTMTLPALNVQSTDGSAWLLGFGGSKSTNANTKNVSGWTTRSGTQGALGLHTKEGNTGNLTAISYDSTVNASGNRMDTVEILAQPDPVLFERSAAIDGVGAIASAPQRALLRSAAVDGAGSIAVAGEVLSIFERAASFDAVADLAVSGGVPPPFTPITYHSVSNATAEADGGLTFNTPGTEGVGTTNQTIDTGESFEWTRGNLSSTYYLHFLSSSTLRFYIAVSTAGHITFFSGASEYRGDWGGWSSSSLLKVKHNESGEAEVYKDGSLIFTFADGVGTGPWECFIVFTADSSTGDGPTTGEYTAVEGGPASIWDDCVAFWKLEDLNDSVGTNHLTNNGSVSFDDDGIIGKCATFN